MDVLASLGRQSIIGILSRGSLFRQRFTYLPGWNVILEEHMKKAVFSNVLRIGMQMILLLAISCFGLGAGGTNVVHAQTVANTDACGQLLAEAEARFQATLRPDGSIPVTAQAKSAATEYIRVSKLCYEQIEAQNAVGTLQGDTPTFIDDGGVLLSNGPSANYLPTYTKWGAGTIGTPGGTVTYSFMGNGLNLSAEPNSANYGTSVAITSLPGFQACFLTEIQNAFAAWQAVSNIQFVQVADNGVAFDAAGATGDIRIGTHAFDGPSGVLAHAYFPPPNGTSSAGDLHFDKAENWKCNTSGIDIGVVALHEIGHSLGLNHENTNTVAVMDPYYNPSLTGLQADDINGATAIYGAASLSSPPVNDNFVNAGTKAIPALPYTDTLDTTGATEEATDPQVNVNCDNKLLRRGENTVWYLYTAATSGFKSLDTLGSDYDTYIAVWTFNAGFNFVACDDDNDAGLQSQLFFNAQAGTTYYIEIAGYAGRQSDPAPTPNPGGNLIFHMLNTGPTALANSVLPTSRSIQVGTPATIFNTVINGGAEIAYGVILFMANEPPGTFSYQESSCSTNVLIGPVNPTLDILPGQARCYVLTFVPSAPFAAVDVHIRAQGNNTPPTSLWVGINTWTLRGTSVQGPDIIALTTTTDFHQVACTGIKPFAVAFSNVGTLATQAIVTADTGAASLSLGFLIQETDPATGVIIGDNVLENVAAGENRTVVVWVTFNRCIPFDPAANRIFIRVRDGSSNIIGSTSTAVSTNR
jgi:hypothetical protein